MAMKYTPFVAITLACLMAQPAYGLSVTLEAEGLDSAERNAVLSSTKLYQQRASNLLSDDLILRLSNQALEEIASAMQAYGYYKASAEWIDETVEGERQIHYRVNPGPVIKVTNLVINLEGAGKADPILQNWITHFPLTVGKPLVHADYESAKNLLFRLCQENGYYHASLPQHDILVDTSENSATIRLSIETGARAMFGDIHFIQAPAAFSTEYLSHYLNFHSGDPFTTKDLSLLQQRLVEGNEFSKVEIESTPPDPVDQRVTINVNLSPRKRNKYSFGIGYGTDTGPRAQAAVERRRVTPGAHNGSVEVLTSKIKHQLTANYRIPLHKPYSDYFLAKGSRIIENTDNNYHQTNLIALSSNFKFTNWMRSFILGFESERFRIGAVAETETRYVIPGLKIRYLDKESIGKEKSFLTAISPGLEFELKGAHHAFGSDADLVQLITQLQITLPLANELSVFSRAKVGATSISSFDKLPASLRFYAGGDQSIRGFSYNSIAPKNATGDLQGGEYLLVASVEPRFRFDTNKELSLFYDTGNAFNGNLDVLESGAGMGGGWYLPFGVLRLYLASALSVSGTPWRLHLTIGADF